MNLPNMPATLRHPVGGVRRPLVLAAAMLGVAACARDHSPDAERGRLIRRGNEDLVVAAPWPWAAMRGVRYGEGMELAIEEVNSANGVHGRRLRLLRIDDSASVNRGRTVAQEIARNPTVVAVVGHLQSYVTTPAAAIYDLAGLVLLAPTASDPQLTSLGYRSAFRLTFTHRHVGRQLADYAGQRGLRRMAIYYLRDGYGRGVANAFEERAADLQMDIVARRSYDANQPTAQDVVDGIVREWKDRDVGGVFVAGEAPEAIKLVTSMRKHGLNVPVLGGDAVGAPLLLTDATGATEGMVVAAAYTPDDPRPEVRRFVDAFRRRFGVAPDAGAALGYNAVSLLAHAMNTATSPAPTDVAEALRQFNDWPSLLGPVRFDSTGGLMAPQVNLLVVRRGQFVRVRDSAHVVALSR